MAGSGVSPLGRAHVMYLPPFLAVPFLPCGLASPGVMHGTKNRASETVLQQSRALGPSGGQPGGLLYLLVSIVTLQLVGLFIYIVYLDGFLEYSKYYMVVFVVVILSFCQRSILCAICVQLAS